MSKKPSDYLFAVYEDDEIGTIFVIFTKKYWKKNRCFDDSGYFPQFLVDNGFHQLNESEYEFYDTKKRGVDLLQSLGCEYSKELEEFAIDHQD